ncbi:MAG: ABC transporter permease [Tissierellia bacterium]|nr:ABC transporter permease [Tissierellia bacterium]
MFKYIVKRIFYMIFVFFVMSLLLFFLYNLIPGDRAMQEVLPLKERLRPEQFQELYEQTRKEMGLDDPLAMRYKRWITNVLKGDLGESDRQKKPVIDIIKPPMRNTIFINIFAIVLALGITIPLGIKTAVKKDTTFDRVVQVVTIIGYSIPVFITALVFIYIFAVLLRWFPVSGMKTANFVGTKWEAFLDTLWHLALPLAILTLTSLAGVTRYVRAAMVDSLSMDYIKTARAKGLSEKTVIYSHAWRNALLPVITLIIGWIMSIFSGAFIIESMFSLNGMGRLYMDSLNYKDFNVVLAIQMFYIIISLVGNLIVDLSYGLVDPRVRVDG